MVFTDDIVRALLTVGRRVAVSEVVAGQALVAGGPGAFEDRKREVRKPIHVDPDGSSTGGSADRIVVRKFDVWELLIPVILELIDHYYQHLGHHLCFTRSTPRLPFRCYGLAVISEPQESCRQHAKAMSKTGGLCTRICCTDIPRGEYTS